jgi:hypothetical protein
MIQIMDDESYYRLMIKFIVRWMNGKMNGWSDSVIMDGTIAIA